MNPMSPKVSVIVPVYKSERYLAACMESLLAQTLQECEFIFVNDGSPDASKQIIESYMTHDPRISLIDQPNQGVSIARNVGIQAAKGVYIGFVDADDEVSPDMYERLYTSAIEDDCDVVFSGFTIRQGEHHPPVTVSYPFPAGVLLEERCIRTELLPYFIASDNLNSVWNKLYKASVIEGHQIAFPEHVALGEDASFNHQLFGVAQSIKYLDYAGYLYRETAGSATRNIAGKDYFKRAVEVFESDLPACFTQRLEGTSIHRLKSIRLIRTVMSIVHMYFEPSQEVSFRSRYRYLKRVIGHERVRESLPFFLEEAYASLGRYQRLLVDMIRRKQLFAIYLATAYSRMKNQ